MDITLALNVCLTKQQHFEHMYIVPHESKNIWMSFLFRTGTLFLLGHFDAYLGKLNTFPKCYHFWIFYLKEVKVPKPQFLISKQVNNEKVQKYMFIITIRSVTIEVDVVNSLEK